MIFCIRVVITFIVILSLFGCLDKKPEVILDQSRYVLPNWVESSEFETKQYFYFVGSFQTDLHTPNYAYKLARKKVHEFFLEQGVFILSPLKLRISGSAFSKLNKKYMTYISSEMMLTIKNNKTVEWEHVLYDFDGEMVSGYRYYVLLKVSKRLLRMNQKRFLLEQIKYNKTLRKSIIVNGLKDSMFKVDELKNQDELRMLMLPDDVDVKKK